MTIEVLRMTMQYTNSMKPVHFYKIEIDLQRKFFHFSENLAQKWPKFDIFPEFLSRVS